MSQGVLTPNDQCKLLPIGLKYPFLQCYAHARVAITNVSYTSRGTGNSRSKGFWGLKMLGFVSPMWLFSGLSTIPSCLGSQDHRFLLTLMLYGGSSCLSSFPAEPNLPHSEPNCIW